MPGCHRCLGSGTLTPITVGRFELDSGKNFPSLNNSFLPQVLWQGGTVGLMQTQTNESAALRREEGIQVIKAGFQSIPWILWGFPGGIQYHSYPSLGPKQ